MTLAPQIEPEESEQRWYHVHDHIPRLHPENGGEASDIVLVWCRKRGALYAGRLMIDADDVYWFTRSLDGVVLVDFQEHVRHVSHWRPLPPPPEGAD